MLRTLLCLLTLVLAVVANAGMRHRCDDGWVCVERTADQGYEDIYVENHKPWPITLSLRVHGRGIEVQGRNPITVTVEGNERIRLTRAFKKSRSSSLRLAYDWAVGSMDAEHDDAYVYRLPYATGAHHYVLQGYGSKFSHTGFEKYTVDFNMPVGTAVHAAREGIVVLTEDRHDRGCWADGCARYANYIVVLHSDGTTGEYYHLRHNGVFVSQGDFVRKGEKIGLSGNTGHTTMPHLHFGVYRAASWGRTASVPVRFQTSSGVIKRPYAGHRYVAD